MKALILFLGLLGCTTLEPTKNEVGLCYSNIADDDSARLPDRWYKMKIVDVNEYTTVNGDVQQYHTYQCWMHGKWCNFLSTEPSHKIQKHIPYKVACPKAG